MIAETSREEPIYLLTANAGVDSYGDPLPDWEHPQKTLIPGAHLTHLMTQDKDVATGTNTMRLGTLIAVGTSPVYKQVTNDSRIQQGSEVWRITGEPNYKVGLMLGNSHLTASLTRTTTEAPNG